jgi:hypothetical protein
LKAPGAGARRTPPDIRLGSKIFAPQRLEVRPEALTSELRVMLAQTFDSRKNLLRVAPGAIENLQHAQLRHPIVLGFAGCLTRACKSLVNLNCIGQLCFAVQFIKALRLAKEEIGSVIVAAQQLLV